MATPLATTADLADRLGRPLTEAEATRATPLLTDASARVRGFTRQDFTPVTGDVVVLRPVGTVLRLPQRPVTAVTQVVAVGGAGQPDVTLAASDWSWDGSDKVDIGVTPPRSDNPWWLRRAVHGNAGTYRVTYSHGDPTVPDPVVAVVCGMVLRTLMAPSPVEGLVSEQIGQYGYQFAQFAGGQSPGANVRLGQADKDALIDAGYRRRATTVQVRT